LTQGITYGHGACYTGCMSGYVKHQKGGFIYGLRCDCHPEDGIRYVGKTTSANPKSRLHGHFHRARKGGSVPVLNWIRKHGEENIVQELLEEVVDGQEALCDREIFWIEELKTYGRVNRGLNCTAGGDGSYGWSRTPESEAKRIATLRERYPKKEKVNLTREEWLGRLKRGSGQTQSKLNEEMVLGIKARIWDGELHEPMATEFGVSKGLISAISTGARWSHVPWPTDRPQKIVSASEKRAALTVEQVLTIRALSESGLSRQKVAKALGISESQAGRVISGERYRWVE